MTLKTKYRSIKQNESPSQENALTSAHAKKLQKLVIIGTKMVQRMQTKFIPYCVNYKLLSVLNVNYALQPKSVPAGRYIHFESLRFVLLQNGFKLDFYDIL